MERLKRGRIDFGGEAIAPEAKPGAKAGAPRVDEFYEDKAAEERRRKKEKEARLAEFRKKKGVLDAKLNGGMSGGKTYGEMLDALKKEFADVLDGAIV